MDQSTEKLIPPTFHQSNGYVNDTLSVSSGPSSLDFVPEASSTPEPPIGPLQFSLGPIQPRRRLLSCIVENWSENESYNSLPMEINKKNSTDFPDIEPKFMGRDSNGAMIEKPLSWEAEDVTDYITTLDESCILDIESYEEIPGASAGINENKTYNFHQGNDLQIRSLNRRVKSMYEPLSNITNQIPLKSGQLVEKYPKIMTASCYGGLNYIDAVTGNEANCNGQYHSTDNLIPVQSKGISDEFLFLNPTFNRSKCRTPFPGVSLNNSLYDDLASVHSSTNGLQHDDTRMIHNDSFNIINPLETSIADGNSWTSGSDIKLFDPEMIAHVQNAAENGK